MLVSIAAVVAPHLLAPEVDVTAIGQLWKARDELNLRNIRLKNWAAIALLPLALIVNDLRLLWEDYEWAGLDSGTLMVMMFGIGMGVAACLPQRAIYPAMLVGGGLSVGLLTTQLILTSTASPGAMTALLVAFQGTSALLVAGGYFTFFFRLRNVERLAAIIVVQLYYAVVDDLLWDLPAFGDFMQGPGPVIFMVLFCVVAIKAKPEFEPVPERAIAGRGGTYSVLILDFSYFIIMSMYWYLEFQTEEVFSAISGLGSLAAVLVVVCAQLLLNRSVYHLWNLFLVLAVVSMALLVLPGAVTSNAGSFIYGLADGVGYVGVLYLLGGAARYHNSYRFFRAAMAIAFVEATITEPGLGAVFALVPAQSSLIALVITAVVVLCGVMTIPVLAKHLFLSDWSDGYHALDTAGLEPAVRAAEQAERQAALELTTREHEVFILLLHGMLIKQIATQLRVSTSTVNFHANNLYRKLGVRGRSELAAQYFNYIDPPPGSRKLAANPCC